MEDLMREAFGEAYCVSSTTPEIWGHNLVIEGLPQMHRPYVQLPELQQKPRSWYQS